MCSHYSSPQFHEAGAVILTSFSSNEKISSKGLSDLPKVTQLLIEEARAGIQARPAQVLGVRCAGQHLLLLPRGPPRLHPPPPSCRDAPRSQQLPFS